MPRVGSVNSVKGSRNHAFIVLTRLLALVAAIEKKKMKAYLTLFFRFGTVDQAVDDELAMKTIGLVTKDDYKRLRDATEEKFDGEFETSLRC